MKDWIGLIRVKHWLKNCLIFLPLFFSSSLFEKEMYLNCFVAFFAFSFVTSIVYINNDINDIEKDRLHPIKKNRPLASGAISIKSAYVMIVILSILALGLTVYLYYLNPRDMIFTVPTLYLIFNILYSSGLKNVPIVDVVILVSGFIFRVMYGGAVINTEVSKFLYLMIIFGSFFLGFGKRRNEILMNGDKSRNVLSMYNKEFLDKNMYLSLALSITSYTLWCVDSKTIERVGNEYLFWTIPIIVLIFLLYSLDIEGDSHGDPIEVILHNNLLIFTILLYITSLFVILYVV